MEIVVGVLALVGGLALLSFLWFWMVLALGKHYAEKLDNLVDDSDEEFLRKNKEFRNRWNGDN